MGIDTLRQRLAEARDHEDWVVAVAGYFRQGGLYFGHGTDNPEDEAFWLIRHLQVWADDAWEALPEPGLVEPLVDLARQRVETRQPLAYVLGEAWFAGLPFFVNKDVLIPRSPVAELIERGFAPWAELHSGDRVLDIGTGSGCIAIATACHCPQVLVDATDVSAAALAVAERNVVRHGCADRILLYNDDLFPSDGNSYRVIISNPPYVPAAKMDALPAEYHAEPELALVGGVTGIELVERLLRGARQRLTSDGVLIVEVGAEAATFAAMFPRFPVIWLEFERGGEGVFVATAEQLDEHFPG